MWDLWKTRFSKGWEPARQIPQLKTLGRSDPQIPPKTLELLPRYTVPHNPRPNYRSAARECMKYLAAVVLLAGLSGCYSSVAVVDLVRRHSPSVILVSVQPDAGTVRIDTTYGSLPSDVVFSTLMPYLHLLTEGTATHALPRDLPCSTLKVRLASPHDSFSRGEVLQITTSPTLVYRAGPFARGLPLGNSPSPPESDASSMEFPYV